MPNARRPKSTLILRFLTAVSCSVWIVAAEPLQPPSPSASESGQPKEAQPSQPDQSAGHDQQRTTNPPIIVNVLPPQKTQAEGEAERHDREEKTELDRRLVSLTADLAIFTGGLFAATVILAVATAALVWATVRLVRGAQDTAERQLRAYVFARPDQVRLNLTGETGEIGIQYEMINTGQTPAYHLRNTGEVRIMPWPLPADFVVQSPDEGDGGHQNVSLGPKQRGIFNMPQMEYRPLTENERFYLIVVVRYRDAFNRDRTTRLCCAADIRQLLASARLGETRETAAQEFHITAQHNDAD